MLIKIRDIQSHEQQSNSLPSQNFFYYSGKVWVETEIMAVAGLIIQMLPY